MATRRPVQGGPALPVAFTGSDGLASGSGSTPLPGIQTTPVPTADTGVNSVAITTSAGTVLVPNGDRLAWWVQNLATTPLYVKMGAGASATVFDFILKGCAAQDDGSGGYISDEVFKGTVSVYAAAVRCKVGALNRV